ncbi:amino acid ABC transporter ATP-binding protein [Ureibacillus manganicus]|uniref:Amino acid ABC transporter ATP-binding protein n=1 Tax=Ureibacillus manganicus DSM 26584 TaxID=1384049 RepID=A0A0A3I959_9BACL|nr:amino acid ABC transporter ATP-binding protein [Ureibacillus manganicus]KGR79293.1 amino acid ABC transporter ATP-binding protein [Ureibacillus manganicus DSM 26584]
MIKVNQLKKSFNDLEVLKDINFEVKRGEVLSIIGPSGSGKSTLLRCLNFLETPNAGTITIDGLTVDVENVKKQDIQQLRKKSAMVFQNYNLFKNKTALQNVTELLIVTKKMPKAEAEKIGMEYLAQVGLADKANKYPVTLSGGQQQRVSIARALALNPSVILFDEPTSSLDPELVSEVLQVIKQISTKDTTMIIVTHEMDFAREVSDNVIFMADGYIVEEGHPSQLFGNPQQARTKSFIQQLNEKH